MIKQNFSLKEKSVTTTMKYEIKINKRKSIKL